MDNYHAQDSPYYGLSLEDQAMLAKIRRGGKTPKAIKRRQKKATSEDYAKILVACTNALIAASEQDSGVRLDRVRIVLKLMFNYRYYFNKGFPYGMIVAYDDWHTYVQFNVDRLIDYLHSIGESAFDAKTLRKELWVVRKEFDKVMWYNYYAIPLCVGELYNEIIPAAAEGKIEKERKTRIYRKHGKRKKAVDKPEEV